MATQASAIDDLQTAGPGGICEDCGHFAYRHNESKCYFPRPADDPCPCEGMLWQGQRLMMDSRSGPYTPEVNE